MAKTTFVAAVFSALTQGAFAQEPAAPEVPQEAPAAAIDWLSDAFSTPLGSAEQAAPLPAPSDIAENALVEDVTVRPLGDISIDATGLLPASATGLPKALWGASSGSDLARRIGSISARSDLLPASRRLLNTLILTELDPPATPFGEGRLFQARVDALLVQALLDEADALLARAGTPTPAIFRRDFDTKLLLGTENAACEQLNSTPGLSPTVQARVFCLARGGDWNAAALTLETSLVLGLIEEDQAELLSRFLDPELFEGEPPLPVPINPSPLTFRLMEAIGESMPTRTLPLAFAHSDLRDTAGWKARAKAAERLAHVGALDPNRFLGVWTEALPAASGGIWDRIEALQRFETALNTGDPVAVGHALAPAWTAMRASGLQNVFADLFATRLAELPLTGDTARLALEVGLLSKNYELLAANYEGPTDARTALWRGIALGDLPTTRPRSATERAIAEGFRYDGVPVRLRRLVSEKRLGEAILRSIELLEGGAAGELDELADALQFFRAVGLEVTARRAALELLLLERRG